jgi:hypothetical protein
MIIDNDGNDGDYQDLEAEERKMGCIIMGIILLLIFGLIANNI